MWYNSIITAVLHSPLHKLLSSRMLLISFTGRKSGKVYTIPVNYIWDGADLLVLSLRERKWWRNLQANARVTLRLCGQVVNANGEAIDDGQALLAGLATCFRNSPQVARHLGVTFGANGQPDPAAIARTATRWVVVRIHPSSAAAGSNN